MAKAEGRCGVAELEKALIACPVSRARDLSS
jgi:hypothetical protein